MGLSTTFYKINEIGSTLSLLPPPLSQDRSRLDFFIVVETCKANRLIIAIIIALFGSVSAYSQVSRTEIFVDFRLRDTNLDPEFGSNAERIEEITRALEAFVNDTSVYIRQVYFCGTASPEGSHQLNLRLAQGRLEALEKAVCRTISVPDSMVIRDNGYIRWSQLISMVEDSNMARKYEILEILNTSPKLVPYHYKGLQVDDRINRLKELDGGRTWMELNSRFFSRMRSACVVLETYREVPEQESRHEPLTIGPVAFMPSSQASSHLERPGLMIPTPPVLPVPDIWLPKIYLKTNGIALGLAIANAAVEVDLCRHLSFNLPICYSAWNYFCETVKFRTLATRPELRGYLSDRNDGLFFGAHFGLGWYNFATNGEFRTQDHDGTSPSVGGGLSVGYKLPVSLDNRWHVEFSLGAGIYPAYYDLFRNYHNGLLVSTHRITYIGLDQANISVSYSFGLRHKKKEGRL